MCSSVWGGGREGVRGRGSYQSSREEAIREGWALETNRGELPPICYNDKLKSILGV